MTDSYDVIIIGAGMVGAALANGLASSGLQIALVDQHPAPPFSPADDPDIRVSALSLGSERYLRQLNAWQHIEAMRLTPYARLAVWDETPNPLSKLLPKSLSQTVFDARPLGHSHLGHIVENRITQRALWQAAQAHSNIHWCIGEGIRQLDSQPDRALVTLGNGQQLTASLVVAADGALSRTRELAGIGVSRDQYEQQALVASVRYQGPVQDITWQAFFPSGPRAFLPLHQANGNTSESWGSLVWYDQPETLQQLKAMDDDAFLAAVQQAFPAELPGLTAVAARASFPIAKQHALRYAQDRVVLVGDAAHTINPLAGQGVNLGFQDAECLQALLKEACRAGDDLAAPRWLADYERQRRPANQRMMLAMDLFYYTFSNRLPPLHLARNLGLGLAQHLPFAKHKVARYAMGIDH
ncbi:MAG: FAD-dependent monooxygenase [Marinobacter sp.]|nr:FAD-dependent monooxygenase [Marinobacter sp.]